MDIACVVRHIDALLSTYTTTHLAFEAHRRGHTVWLVRARDLVLDARGRVFARARRCRIESPGSPTSYLESVQGPEAERDVIRCDALDLLFLRGNPQVPDDADRRLGSTVLQIARLLRERGVRVINDPEGLQRAGSKIYPMTFPEDVRPRTFVSTDAAAIKRFLRQLEGPAVLKPGAGFGGESVFYVRRGQVANLNQYIEAVRKTGYVIAQEYLGGARKGDKRLLLLDGEPLVVAGHVAIYRRTHARDDIRNNMHVGGKRARTALTDAERLTVARIAPRLRADGLYFCGVDLVDAKVLEVNVWSPGGIRNINELYGIDVASAVIDDLEGRHAKRRDLAADRAS